jgi:ABC-2 type transport system ATP-binding protein
VSSLLPASNVVLIVEGLCKTYGRTVAVGPLSFSLTVGSTTGLLGGNGAGKTTTIGIIMGLIEPTSGSIRVFGHDMAHERHHVLGRTNFESPYVDMPHRLTVRQNLRIFARLAEDLALVEFPRSCEWESLGGTENARGPRQGADQRSRIAAARRADGLTRS